MNMYIAKRKLARLKHLFISRIGSVQTENGGKTMADREKVIDHLLIIRTWNEVGKAYAYDEMDKKEKTKTVEWIDDALELLKEQDEKEDDRK